MADTNTKTPNVRLIPLNKWPEFHPWPSVGGLRHMAFYRDTNGFNEAFVKIGRRLLIDESKFFECCRKVGAGK